MTDARETQRLAQKLTEGLRDGRLQSAIFNASDRTWPVQITEGLVHVRSSTCLLGVLDSCSDTFPVPAYNVMSRQLWSDTS